MTFGEEGAELIVSAPVSASPASPPAGLDGRDLWVVLGLVGLLIGLPVIAALVTGSFGIPQNDDWAFRRIAIRIVEGHGLSYGGWPAQSLLGLIFVSLPFAAVLGTSWWVFSLVGALLAAAAVVVAYLLARRFVSTAWSVFAVLLVGALPGLVSNATNFMTDLPGTFTIGSCLLLGVAAARARRHQGALLAAVALVGLFAFSIREFAIVAPLSVFVVVGARQLAARRRCALLSAALLLLSAALFHWIQQLPGIYPSPFHPPTRAGLALVLESFFAVALALSPLVALRMPWLLERLSWRSLAATVVVVGSMVLLGVRPIALFPGNYLTQQGMGGVAYLPGARPVLIPGSLWDPLNLLGLLAGILLACLLAEGVLGFARADAGALILVCFSGTFSLASAVFVVLRGASYDRYLWPLELALGVALLASMAPAAARGARRARGPGRGLVLGSCALLAVLLAVAGLLAANSDVYSAARWRAGEQAVALGIPPDLVSAGFEWVGAHSGEVEQLHNAPADEPGSPAWDTLFPPHDRCAFVFGSPITQPGFVLVGMQGYRLYGLFGHDQLYLYRSTAPACATVGERAG
jgi:hypothetical protein